MVRINQSRRYLSHKSLVTYTIAESGITGDTTNIYSLIVWDPTDATEEIDWSVTPFDLLAVSYPNNKTARENSRDDYGDFTPTSQSTWIIKNATESTVMSVTISGEECLGINQTASRAIWRIDGVAQSGRTGTVDCDNELHNIQFNGG